MAREKVPKLLPISEEMKQWSAMLSSELSAWPRVVAKPMFGMTALYRDEQIFACLPKTKSFETPKAIGFRLGNITAAVDEELRSDERIIRNPIGSLWISFEIDGPADLNVALQWLERAYEQAKRSVEAGAKIRKKAVKSSEKAHGARSAKKDSQNGTEIRKRR